MRFRVARHLAPALSIALALFAGLVAACSSTPPTAAQTRNSLTPPAVTDTAPTDLPGLHNVVAFHDGFYSGSSPQGTDAFASLGALGVKTIISVDGAEPDVAAARAHGLRYIHLPIGYNGFDEERKLQLVRATRDAMTAGPVYIHCHHGKHRSAAAAASIAASLGWLTPDQGISRMKVSGTAPNYTGLYACAANSGVLAGELVDAVPARFPEIWRPGSFVRSMVEIDNATDHLKLIEAAGWNTPAAHPDLVPAAEAGRLADHLRDLITGARTARESPDFAASMRASHQHAQALEDILAASPRDTSATSAASARFTLLVASCKDCHARFRD